MLHWLKKLVSRPTPPSGPAAPASAGLQEFGEGLHRMLAGVDAVGGKAARAGLAQDIASFVATGEPAAVLHELVHRPDLADHLGITSRRTETRADGTAFYAHLHTAPPDLLVRWGKVLQASTTATTVARWALDLEGQRHWLEALVLHASGWQINTWQAGGGATPQGLTAASVEAALVADGTAAPALVRCVFTTPVGQYTYIAARIGLLVALPGFADALHRHRDAVRDLLLPSELPQRLHVLTVLAAAHDTTLGELADALIVHATSTSKQVRAAAEPLVLRATPAVIPALRNVATGGQPDARAIALRLLARIAETHADAALRDFTRTTAASDKAASVRELLVEWDTSANTPAANDVAVPAVELPAIDWHTPVTPELDAMLAQFFDAHARATVKHNAEVAKAKAARGSTWMTEWDTFTPRDQAALRALLAGKEPPGKLARTGSGHGFGVAGDLLRGSIAATEPSPAVVAKVLAFFDLFGDRETLGTYSVGCFEALHARTGRPTLLEIAALAAGCGIEADGVLRAYCRSWAALGRDWPPEHVWPLFAREIDRVVTLLKQPPSDYRFDREALFRGIATLPSMPSLLANHLFELALGTGKTDRPLAQAAVANVVGKEQRIVRALADGKAEVRAIAAAWLRALRHAPAIPELEAAVGKEKNDVTKGALLDALEGLGCPIEQYLDRDALAKDARRTLAKGLPKELAWLRGDALPAVRWRDTGAPVEPDVLLSLCVQACKAKSPEPNVMLRKYTAMFEPTSAQAFAQLVLESWLHEDTAPITPEHAQKLAQQQAQSTHASIRQYPQYHQQDPNRDLSVEELIAKFLPGLLRQPRGSAIASKGVLAVAAACGGERVVAPVGRYLKEWFGTRAAQGKALIAMLAWVDHPAAIQLMLSVGNRFRTKSFQEEAMKQAQALAERRGWTLAELADRTMPTAGFDERGVLELDYGERTFTAHLHADLSVELRNPDGKKVAALPEPRSGEDPELAKAAKKAFSSAKKELKTIAALQTDRLYEALCTGRDWSTDDWRTFLLPHPVVRHLAQRLVWLETGADGSERVFRPLDDGTLTDANDEPVELRAGARIRLAHDSNLHAERIAAWQRHLADYEVSPLFQQLGKGTWQLPADQARATKLEDFLGHVLEAFALRGRAGKLGYVRGRAEDGGWFRTYEKRFPTLGITAVIEFTGNPLPETNRTVALEALSFTKKAGERDVELPLGDVPAVLLSECWQDVRLCAAEGPGFAADWEKQSEYR